MQNIKTYDQFVNEGWALTALFYIISYGIVAPIYLILFGLTIPFLVGDRLYKKYFVKDWRLFARANQVFMDLLWSYSIIIKKIDEYGAQDELDLQSKEIKRIKKVKKILLKKFGKIDLTEEDVKNYMKKMFNKISKVEDREIIYNMIDNYQVREIQIDKKVIKNLESILNTLELRNIDLGEGNDIEKLDPFGEEDWNENEDEENIDNIMGVDLEEPFYFMKLIAGKNDMYSSFLGKGTIRGNLLRGGGYDLEGLHLSEKEIKHAMNKYYKYYNVYGKYITTKLYSGKNETDLVIVPEDNRDLFLDIVKANIDVTKYILKKYCKEYENDEYTGRLLNRVDNLNAVDLVNFIDRGFNFQHGGQLHPGGINIFNWTHHSYLYGEQNLDNNRFHRFHRNWNPD